MKLSKYRFIIKPQRELILPPYKGSTLRGGLGIALKHTICMDEKKEHANCTRCVRRYKCVYSYVFETSVPDNSNEKKQSKKKDIPHPYIIEPRLDQRRYYGLDDRLDFNLILVGRAIDYIPYIILAFKELGRTGIGKNGGKYSLEKVISLNTDDEIPIYESDSHVKADCHIIDSAEIVREASQLNYHMVTLHFFTPTRIKNERYLFNWNLIPGNDTGKLIGFLKKKFNPEWIEKAKIEKINDAIRISFGNNFLFLKLNDEKTRVNLKINDVRTDEFIAKTNNYEINVFEKSKLTIEIDFEIVMRNLLRRLSWLAEYHCNEKWELKWKELIQRSTTVKTVHSNLKWHDWDRYSERQGTKMKMGGFLGEITFEGDLAEFVPFLKLGEFLHIGKETVFGLGKYEIKGE